MSRVRLIHALVAVVPLLLALGPDPSAPEVTPMAAVPTNLRFSFTDVLLVKDGDYCAISLAPLLGDDSYAWYGPPAKTALITPEECTSVWEAMQGLDLTVYERLDYSRLQPSPDHRSDDLRISIDGQEIHAYGNQMLFDDAARTPLLALGQIIRDLHAERVEHLVVPERLSLELSLVHESWTDSYAFSWIGTEGQVRHNHETRPTSATDRDDLWATLLAFAILDRGPWAIDFQFGSDREPYMLPRYCLRLHVNGAEVLDFAINAPYFTEQPIFEQLRSWLEARLAHP